MEGIHGEGAGEGRWQAAHLKAVAFKEPPASRCAAASQIEKDVRFWEHSGQVL